MYSITFCNQTLQFHFAVLGWVKIQSVIYNYWTRLSKVLRFISGEQINYLPKQFTETNLGNSGRLDQTRVFNELKF